MLIITRNIGGRLIIGNKITITVLDAIDDERACNGVEPQARLGIEAPREISVNREEIYKKIKAEKAVSS